MWRANWRTTIVGLIKSAVLLATTFATSGSVDTRQGIVLVDPGSHRTLVTGAVIYGILSAVQAVLTRDSDGRRGYY